MVPIPEGSVVRSAALPLVWGLNHVRLAAPVGFGEAVSLADRHLADLPYRHLVLDEAAGPERLAVEFEAAGWRMEREVTMVLAGPPDRRADTSRVLEASEVQALPLYHRWVDEELDESEEARRQVVEQTRRSWEVRNARRLAVAGDSGELAAVTVLLSDDTVAQVEDVYTVPEQRRRGLARTLVTRALELADEGAYGLTFIVADDRDWPKQLYARLGFEPAGRTWSFHRAGAPAR